MDATLLEGITDPLPRPRTRRRLLQNIVHAPRIAQCAVLATVSFIRSVPIFLANRPRTPLRVLCIAALDYALRLEGRCSKPDTRVALACACDFGALCNDFYDQHELNRMEYRTLRTALRRLVPETITRDYIRNLRWTERRRPVLRADTSFERSAIEYRNRVLVLSMRWLYEIADLRRNATLFQAFVALTGLFQLVDDVLDWEDDCKSRRPSYVTGILTRDRSSSAETAARIQRRANHFRDILIATSEEQPEAAPLAIAGFVVWGTAVTLARIRFVR